MRPVAKVNKYNRKKISIKNLPKISSLNKIKKINNTRLFKKILVNNSYNNNRINISYLKEIKENIFKIYYEYNKK